MILMTMKMLMMMITIVMMINHDDNDDHNKDDDDFDENVWMTMLSMMTMMFMITMLILPSAMFHFILINSQVGFKVKFYSSPANVRLLKIIDYCGSY